eukprot:TRINITY_DN4199_c0_g1_i9.p1 TRINITY_DN4199_c0_g1~~TRINITY_DN4199_c0_g1_i9.p1  ORF type:complete len:150 (+),score=16.23 TRINITY_DN4199_c0_g1_i9:169-618(+)
MSQKKNSCISKNFRPNNSALQIREIRNLESEGELPNDIRSSCGSSFLTPSSRKLAWSSASVSSNIFKIPAQLFSSKISIQRELLEIKILVPRYFPEIFVLKGSSILLANQANFWCLFPVRRNIWLLVLPRRSDLTLDVKPHECCTDAET